jgi:hypothetical protein
MSTGLDNLLSDLVTRKEFHDRAADSIPLIDSDWRYHMSQLSRLDIQIERVLSLLERD